MNVGGQRKSRRSRRAPMSEINVVPYIDVTFVLLMIFMITAPLVQTGVDVDLPQADANPVDLKNDPPLIVSIDKEGQLFVSVGGEDDEPVGEEELSERVSAVLSTKPQTQVFVKGDRGVDYGKIVTVMVALKKAGAPAVGLSTEPPGQ